VLLRYLRANGREQEADQREIVNARLAPYEKWDTDGHSLLRHDKLQEAEMRFRKVLELAPSYSYSWANLGLSFIKRKNWDSALVYLKTADGLNPFNTDNRNALGYVYLNLGDTTKGERYCRQAVELDPRNFTARGNLIQLYTQQQRREELIDLLVDVLELDSLSYQVLFHTASQLLEVNAPQEASQVCRRALEDDPKCPILRDLKERYPDFQPHLNGS